MEVRIFSPMNYRFGHGMHDYTVVADVGIAQGQEQKSFRWGKEEVPGPSGGVGISKFDSPGVRAHTPRPEPPFSLPTQKSKTSRNGGDIGMKASDD